MTPCGRRTRQASLTKSIMLVPMSDRQKTAACTEALGSGTWAMSQAVTRALGATRSKECTLVRFCCWTGVHRMWSVRCPSQGGREQ